MKLLLLIAFLIGHLAFAQNKADILMYVDGEPILATEFVRVYNKNLDLVKDDNQKNIEAYLELFTQYQLKLKEAKRLKLDEDPKYKREFTRYKGQLTKNYLSENKISDVLVKEAYERSQFDISAAHALVRIDESATDTLKAYNEVLALRERILKEGFNKVKAEVHDGQRVFLEDLGYFSAFKMVYGFETAAYNTAPGEISLPFRTQFGYHVVMVREKRPTRGTITAAHIMVALEQTDSTLKPEKRIHEIYTKLNQGEPFDALAKQFSDDKSSARNGGTLAPFKSGQLNSPDFEDQAFALNKDGDYSEPFKTAYGWHIVKRIKLEPLQPYDVLKPSLESRVKRDSRSKLINKALVEELRKRYDITYDKDFRPYFVSILTDDYFKRSWESPADLPKDKVIFSINNRTLTYGQFGRFLEAAQRSYFNKKTNYDYIIDRAYANFFEKSILKYREDNLELENEDFAQILKEYRDGLLLFDLMEKEIWNKASQDSVGLLAYYNTHKSEYHWKQRAEVIIASSATQEYVLKCKKMLEQYASEEDISSQLNTDGRQHIIFTKGVFPIDHPKLPKGLVLKEGISDIYQHNQAYHVIDILELLPAGAKSFEEARGAVINDYQSQLEENWILKLKSRFDVNINNSVFKKIKKQIDNNAGN